MSGEAAQAVYKFFKGNWRTGFITLKTLHPRGSRRGKGDFDEEGFGEARWSE